MKNVAKNVLDYTILFDSRKTYFNEDKKEKKKCEERCQRIESNHTFLDLTTDSNCHRPTTSLRHCLWQLGSSCSSTTPLVYCRSSFLLPLILFLFPICARVRVSMHAYTFGNTDTRRYHYRHTVANCPTTPVLFLRSTPSRTRYFVTVSLSSPSFFFHLHALCYSYNTFAREYSSEMLE